MGDAFADQLQHGRDILPIDGGVFTADRPQPLPYDGHQSTPHGTTVADENNFALAGWFILFGWWSDNTRTPFGRRRPFILVGSVLSGMALPLLFAAQPGWSEEQYFWFMVATQAVFVPIMSCFYMPFLSIAAELTPDYHERTSLAAFRSVCQKVPEVAMFAAAAFTR